MRDDVAPAWRIPAPRLNLVSPNTIPPGIDSWIIVVNDAQQRIGLGFHELYNGQPVGYVLVEYTKADGQTPSRVFSHEVIEMAIDPDMTRTSSTNGKQYLVEVGDVLSFDAGGYTIDGTLVSGFGMPAYFNLPNGTGSAFSVGPFGPDGTHSDPVAGPLPAAAPANMGTMLCFLENGQLKTEFPAAIAAPPQFMTQPHSGSRRFRRTIPRDEWRDRQTPSAAVPQPISQPTRTTEPIPAQISTSPTLPPPEPLWAKPGIAIFTLIVFAFALVVVWLAKQGMEGAFNLLIGAVIANATNVIGYYFGSSSGSTQKTALLASGPPPRGG